jgi:ABC-type antimicrobial peptide transport system permease subunit
MSVDPGFKDFFKLNMLEGNWFGPNSGAGTFVINEAANNLLDNDTLNALGVYKDFNSQFNLPEKPTKLKRDSYLNYNFLYLKVLEVDIQRTVQATSSGIDTYNAKKNYLNKHFEEWVRYQDKLNSLSKVLAIISLVLSCIAIYGLSISIVRDKLKQIAIHKLCGAGQLNITYILIKEFINQVFLTIIIFGPLTYLALSELLRSFAYATPFHWIDPILPLAYCTFVITLLCGFQAIYINKEDLSAALKG